MGEGHGWTGAVPAWVRVGRKTRDREMKREKWGRRDLTGEIRGSRKRRGEHTFNKR
jgi:hypothetical protein